MRSSDRNGGRDTLGTEFLREACRHELRQSVFLALRQESDAVVIFNNVKVPWVDFFLLNDVQQSREMYFRTPSHVMGNHQSIVRYHEKLKIILDSPTKRPR